MSSVKPRLLIAAVLAALAVGMLLAASASANTSNDDWSYYKVPKQAGVNGPDARELIITRADGSQLVIDCLATRDPMCAMADEPLVDNVTRLRAMGAQRLAFHVHEHDGPVSEFRDARGYDLLDEHLVIPATDDAPTKWRITQSYAFQPFAFVHEDLNGPSINEMRAMIARDRQELSLAAVKSKVRKAKAKAKAKRKAKRR